jgi:hypothetical protein
MKIAPALTKNAGLGGIRVVIGCDGEKVRCYVCKICIICADDDAERPCDYILINMNGHD